jgi:MtfA peptidase
MMWGRFFETAEARRRRQLREQPFPEEWLAFVRDNVLLYRLLDTAEQAKLHEAVQILVAEKNWEGCAGLELTEEIAVAVAAQAGLLLLGLEGYYFDEVKTVLVYPGGFLAQDPYGRTEELSHRLGEAHHKGPVVLSWWEVCWDGRRLGERNLVLHEFAHKLTELGDPERGLPPLDDPELASRWEEVTTAERKRLEEYAAYGRRTLLDPYGATNEAEFFAVTTECFFLRPVELRRRHPDLYQLFAAWYRQDPAARHERQPELLAQAEDAEDEYVRHALAECTAAIRLRPDFVDAYRHRAELYCEQEAYDLALADYGTVIRLTSDDDRAEAHCERGVVYRWKGDHDQALADFDAALQLCPDYARAYCERGITHAAHGEREKALADLDRALRLDPRDDAAYLERGVLHAETGAFEKAVKDFTKAIRLNPEEAEAYRQRAEAYAALGEAAKADRDRARARKLGRTSS